ncbi:ComEC family competence protein [Mucilaginibacter sp. JRF]|uniref:ComEC/Rec2 family competence protein n=1 Tax=Mucilaginibacter sp. JRF TaxID=2780088 RepID=UPI0018808528|nr:ComEC/Rec2 family competence protein [Mucilaginibacter sp. JRF]MBE9586149.1 ComEC family competence protein [Mucilaginibacter sp. JRF]
MKASHKDAFPFVLLFIPYAAGIFCRVYYSNFFGGWPLWPILLLAAVFTLFNLLYKPLKVFRYTWFGGITALTFLFVAGILITGNSIEIDKFDHFSKTKAENLLVKVITEPVNKNGNTRFTAKISQAVNNNNLLIVNGKLQINLSEQAAKNINYGDVLLMPATYKPVSPPLNPAEFNYSKYLAHKNIYHQAYLSPGQFSVVKTNTGNSLMAYAQQLRKRLVDKFKLVITDPDAAAVASTLILGYSAELSNDVLQAYSKTGTIHVLSVSGAHVGLVYLVLVFLLAPLNNGARGRILVTLIVIACIWCYALLTGFSPPVCRAGIMLSFILLGRCFARRISQLNILAVSAFITLLIDPLLITDVGFQLSYIAVGGLIVLQPIIYQKFSFKNKFADKLWLICSASVAAQLVTLPLSTYYFHQVPVYFLVSNLVILIPSALIMYGGILYLFIPKGWLIAKWISLLVEKLILLTNDTLSVIEHAPWSVIDRVWLSYPEFILSVLIVILVSYCLFKLGRAALLSLSFLLIVFISFRLWNNYLLSNTNEMVFFSLRSNSAIALRTAKHVKLITDVDSNSKTYNYSIKPYMDSCGIDEVDMTSFESLKANKNKSISFNGKQILVVDARDSIPTNNASEYIYLRGKVSLNDIHLTKHQTIIIAGKSNSKYKQNIAEALKPVHIKYMVSGSNKALIIPSNQ